MMRITDRRVVRLTGRLATAGLVTFLLAGNADGQARPGAGDQLLVRPPVTQDGLPRGESASSGTIGVSFEFRSAVLKEALQEVAERSGLRLVYADGLLSPAARVTARGEGVPPRQAFAMILSDTSLEVLVLPAGYAVVVRRDARIELMPLIRLPPLERKHLAPSIRGTVLGPENRSVAGAYVRLCGTRQVQLTDDAGRFEFPGIPRGEARISITLPGRPEFIAQVVASAPDGPSTLLRLESANRAAATPSCPDR